MTKLVLDVTTSGINIAKINENFQKISDEFQNKVLYRNNPVGEPNSISSDLDMNSKVIFNASDIRTAELTLDGVEIGASIAQTLADTTAQQTIATTKASEAAASAALALGYLNDVKERYYGALASNPTLDPLGQPITTGDEYFNTTSNLLFRYNGATWQASDINTANLAASSGAGLVGFITDGAGSTATTVQDQLRQIIVFRRFGIIADGVTDDSAALQNLVNALYDGKRHTINFFYFSLYLATPVKLKPGISIANATIKGSIFVGDEFVASATPTNFLNPRIHNIDFIQDSLVAGTYALKYQMAWYAGNVTGCTFTNYDKAIWVPQLTVVLAVNVIQHVHRLTIENNKYNSCNYFIKTEKPTVTPFSTGDIHVINNNGEAKITNVRMEGADGLVCTGNTFFQTGFTGQSAIKEHNVYLDYCNWVKLTGNNYFEAGLEAISVSHFQNMTISGGSIAWCGQRIISDGIKLSGGGVAGTADTTISAITGITIQFPTGSGITLDNKCNKVSVTGNVVESAGLPDFYYGAADITAVSHWGIYVNPSAFFNSIVGNLTPDNENSIDTNINSTNFFALNFDNHRNALIKPQVKSLIATETTVSAYGANQLNLAHTSPTTLSSITNGVEGQEMYILAFNGNSTIQHNTSVRLRGAVDAVLSAENNLTLKFSVGKWRERSRNF